VLRCKLHHVVGVWSVHVATYGDRQQPGLRSLRRDQEVVVKVSAVEAEEGVFEHFGHSRMYPVLAAGHFESRLLEAHCLDQRLNQ
jgi:hypothetical protein